jgi:2'-5' RNA ligase
MGRFFTSFDEAWEFFLDRDSELEDFFASFPVTEQYILGWLLPADRTLRSAIASVQESFSQLDWVTPLAADFLHVWISAVSASPHRPEAAEIASALEGAARVWADVEAFDLVYPQVNCFHDGVVAETRGDGPRRLLNRLVDAGISRVPLDTFLPHLTLGVFNASSDPTTLRNVLAPLRETELGQQRVTEAVLCVIPASRTTILDPWEVVGSVAFGSAT